MRVLITGGLGNLGLWVTDYLLQKNFEIHVIGRSEKLVINHPNYTFIKADITDLLSLSKKILLHYDYCIHLASYNEHFKPNYEEDALQINALGTENLCRALSVYGVDRLVYLSTFHVYGSVSGYLDENTVIKPNNAYGLTHYFAEKYVELYSNRYKFDYCIFRLTNSYGCPKSIATDKWYLVLNDLCKQAYDTGEIKLKGNGKSQRDFIWMGDVARVIYSALSRSDLWNDHYNLSANNMLSINDIATIVKSAFRCKFNADVIVYSNNTEQYEDSILTVSNKKLLSIMNWSFNDKLFEEALNIFSLLDKNN